MKVRIMLQDQDINVPARWQIILAFAAVYLIWGSTYLAIRYAIETLPPLLMAGTRFLVAGGILYSWARVRGASSPTRLHWRAAFLVGGLLLLGGNGAITWAEQIVPSSVAALMVALVPMWMVLLEGVAHRTRPDWQVTLGLGIGLTGIVMLIGPGEIAGTDQIHPLGAVLGMVASLSWAAGSLYSRRASLPKSPALATGIEMLAGGALLVTLGILLGEESLVAWQSISLGSLAALGYLIVFGSLIGFSSFVWLLRVSTPARVSTHGYVNPVVAVFLGWAIAGEPLTTSTITAATLIVIAVILITTYHRAHHETDASSSRQGAPQATTGQMAAEACG